MKLNWLIIGIPILVLIILAIVLFVTSSQDSNYVNKNEIVDYFNDLNYDVDGAPQGGFLISMLPMSNICEKYKWTTTSDCASVDTCGKILNVADINDWLTSILPGGTNCYNIATTYWRKDFPQYVFGPYKGDDMTIGVLLNVTTIFDYIAGMYPMDSGTVARYNNFCSKTLVDNPPFQKCCDCPQRPDTVCYPEIDPSKFITSDKSQRKSKWHNWLATPNSNVLGMGGIGKLVSGKNTGGLYGLRSADQWLAVTPTAASDQLAKIAKLRPEALEAPDDPYDKDSYTPGWSRFGRSFTVSNDNVPFDKYNWALWAKAVKICYENAEQDRLNYVDSQDLGFDGYRENEVDLIIPNKSRKCSETSQGPCEVQDAFKKVFINSIMGIISVAEDNCSNSTVNAAQGPGGVGCVDGTDNCQSEPSERQSIKDPRKANPVTCLSNKNNCFDPNGTYWCTKSNKKPKVKCCCSQEFSENLVKKMVDEFNNSALRTEAGARKIHGYRVRCESIYSFSWKGMNKPINIEQIT